MQVVSADSPPCFIPIISQPFIRHPFLRWGRRSSYLRRPGRRPLTGTPTMNAGRKAVILCPGQGSQVPMMGRDWAKVSRAAAEVIERADEVYGTRFGGRSLSELLFGGEKEQLDRTDIAQPGIFVVSMACWAGLKEMGLLTDADLAVVAGLSLGEYTALTIAGALEYDQALELVALRGMAMQEAAEETEGGMVALIGADEEKAKKCVEAGAEREEVLVAANFNAPGQVVLSGSKTATDLAAEFAVTKLKLKVAKLDVAGAFHSPLMDPAAQRLAEALEKASIVPPKVPVISNVTAAPHTPEEIRKRLVEQLTSPVLWSSSMNYIRNDESLGGGGQRWIELAPGKTLKGLMRKIDRKLKVDNMDGPPSMDVTAENKE